MGKAAVGVICFLAGIVLVPVLVLLYLKIGVPPVAVTDPAFPFEKTIVEIPLEARIKREMPSGSPMQPTETNLLAGARVYAQNCAFCHGVPNKNSEYAKHMYPAAPQLWLSHGHGVVGVSDDPVGETYWKVKNGIRLTAMPAYADLLSENQMWQVTLLLKGADQTLPTAAQTALAAR